MHASKSQTRAHNSNSILEKTEWENVDAEIRLFEHTTALSVIIAKSMYFTNQDRK